MRRIAPALAFVLLVACTTGVPETELYGAYVATYANGSEKLTLEKGGTFVQEIRLKGSDSAVVNSGTWQVRRPSNRPDLVELQNCLAVGDGFGRVRTDFATNRGGCSFTVERRFVIAGHLRLGPDESAPLWKVQ
ncbi:MAG: hypothetical protein ACRDF9_00530 [Candidatus Limnocylindria bacterium]